MKLGKETRPVGRTGRKASLYWPRIGDGQFHYAVRRAPPNRRRRF